MSTMLRNASTVAGCIVILAGWLGVLGWRRLDHLPLI